MAHALDAAPPSDGPGGPAANERRGSIHMVARLPQARLTARPTWQAERVERLCGLCAFVAKLNTSP